MNCVAMYTLESIPKLYHFAVWIEVCSIGKFFRCSVRLIDKVDPLGDLSTSMDFRKIDFSWPLG